MNNEDLFDVDNIAGVPSGEPKPIGGSDLVDKTEIPNKNMIGGQRSSRSRKTRKSKSRRHRRRTSRSRRN